MMEKYLRVDPGDAKQEMGDTKGYHIIFRILYRLYKYHMNVTIDADGDNAHVTHNKIRALRSYLLYMVYTSIFVDKSAYYVDGIYLRHFIDLWKINEYNQGATFLVYL